jgi:hypothetical protein
LDGPLHLLSDSSKHAVLVKHGTRLGLKNKTKKALDGSAEKALKAFETEWKKKATPDMDCEECKAGDAKWVTNEDAPVCQCCETKFSMLKRRHHCRRCGLVICGDCNSKKAKSGGKSTVKVCDGCFNLISLK